MVWGLMWYPFRALQQEGVPAELATLLSYLLALLFGAFALRAAWRDLRAAGWWGLGMTLCAGWTNLGYVLAVVNGEVMRVLLLFYLAPLWTVMLAHWLLGERLNRYGYAIIALSLGGAYVMLARPGTGLPLPQNIAELIGLSAGLSFALSNVLVRRVQYLSIQFKAASVWLGTGLLTLLFLLYRDHGLIAQELPGISAYAWLMLALLGVTVCATTFVVLHGLTLVPANQAVILFLSELVFAAASSYLLAGEGLSSRETAGALLIISASLLSGRVHAHEASASTKPA